MIAGRTVYRWEKIADLLAEPNLPELIREYWEELSPEKNAAPLDVDWGMMREGEAEGWFKVWAARSGGTLAGFIGFQVRPHFMYRSTMMAIDSGHYLAPAFRDTGRLGFRMWRTAEAALRAEGVKIIVAHDNLTRPLMPFFLALGYEPRSILYWKAIGDG